jgi:hypothetical protein
MADSPKAAAPAAKKRSAADFFFKHGEKVAVGVSAAILAATLGWQYGMDHDQEPIVAAGRATEALAPKSEKYQKEHADRAAALASAETAGAWKSMTSAKPIHPWASTFKTDIKVRERTEVRKVEAKEIWLLPGVKLGDVAVDHSGVRIDFEIIPPKTTSTQTEVEAPANLTGWEIQRRRLASKPGDKDGEWEPLDATGYKISQEKVGEGPAQKLVNRFKDTSIAPKTKYAYRFKPVGAPTKEDGYVQPVDFSEPKEAPKTAGEFRWTINSFMPNPDGKAEVGIYVYKYDRTLNNELLGKLHHLEGDRIGVYVEDAILKKYKRVHRAYDATTPGKALVDANRRPVEVDFDTGARVTKLETVDVESSYKVCKTSFDATGIKKCDGTETKSQLFKAVNHVVIVDDEGVEEHWWKGLRGWSHDKPAQADQLCVEHGGVEPERKPPPEPKPKTDEKPKPTPEPAPKPKPGAKAKP